MKRFFDALDWTLILALYGALLSSFLGINEHIQNKRKIKVFLVFESYRERFKLSIVNISKRPITIIDISLSVKYSGEDFNLGDPVPTAFLFENENPYSFPFTLSDGEQVDFLLAEPVQKAMEDCKNKVDIFVFDAEGRKFSEFKYMEHDCRYGHFIERK
jgi:hypothetical protein